MNMLNKNPVKRLNKISNIKTHPWWKKFDWNELFSLEMKSPYSPKIKIKDEEYPRIPYVTFLKVKKYLNIFLFLILFFRILKTLLKINRMWIEKPKRNMMNGLRISNY